jgi:predicted permease
MRLRHILRSRLYSLFFRSRRESDLDEELQFHLDRETERLRSSGLTPEQAVYQARRAFGVVEPLKDACRDTRGTAGIENLWRDIRYAFRSFGRTPLVAVTIVFTVGVGLGLVTVVFTVLNAVVFRVDQVRDPYELYAVERQRPGHTEATGFTRRQYEAIVQETGVFTDAFAQTPEIDTWIDGRRMEGPLVTGNFFHLLGVSAGLGRTLTPADDQPGVPPAIVLSHRAWSQHFAGDPGVLSRPILLNGSQVHVVGIMPEGFRGLTVVPPDFWAPLSFLGEFRRQLPTAEDSAPLQVIGRLKPGLSRGESLARLLAWDARQVGTGPSDRTARRLVLEPRQGTIPLSADVMFVFMPLFFAFGLVLMIGWANVANLLLARAVARQREIGIRLAIGAKRSRIIRQLLTESLLLALVSAALALGISRLVLGVAIYAMTSTWASGFGDLRLAVPPADWRVALFLGVAAMISTVFFALAPSFRATRLELVRAMRGELVREARPDRARNALVALQVTGSVLLLICAAVFLRSTWAAAAIDPGIRTADVVNIEVMDEERRPAVLGILGSDPVVASVAASRPGGLGGRTALAEGLAGQSSVTAKFVSPEYFEVFGVDLMHGRGFTPAEQTADALVAVVSETVARQLWPQGAVGQLLRLEPDPNSPTEGADELPILTRSLVVVGIARDVPGFRLGGARTGGAGVYLPVRADTAKASLAARVRGDSERARRTLADRFAAVDPNMAEASTLQTLARMEAYLLAIPFWLTLVLGGLALLLTLSGLFSVLSYLVEQRTREIGVRMALGATRGSIARLVLAQSARPVGIGLLLGSSLTATLGIALLATPAAEQIGSAVNLLDPAAYAVSLLCIVVACACAALLPALRAGRIDPIGPLRQD